MRRMLISVITLAVVASTAPGFGQEAKDPRIVMNEMHFDAGKVTQGVQISHVFEIRNAGTAPLVIERVQPS